MSHTDSVPPLQSGLIELTSRSIDRLPEAPAVYRLRSSGQKVMYVGHAGDEGLREAIRNAWSQVPVAGVSLLEYTPADSGAEAEAAAQADVRVVKPLYNAGFERFRNDDTSLPKKGHRIRKAMQNP